MGKRQFLMNTGARCFLCLKLVGAARRDDGGAPPPPELFSFHSICQYLNLSLENVLSLPLLQESELKGTLCKDCTRLAERFSEHFLELEVIKMKVNNDLKSIYERMLRVGGGGAGGTSASAGDGGGGKLEEFKREMLSRPGNLTHYRIVSRVRRKTMEQCSRKLGATSPRVSLERLSDDTDDENDDEVDLLDAPTVDVKMEVIPDLELALPTGESILIECGISHAKVPDLFSHVATDHHAEEMEAEAVGGNDADEEDPMETGNGDSSKAQRYQCDLCSSNYAQRNTLRRHRRRVHGLEEPIPPREKNYGLTPKLGNRGPGPAKKPIVVSCEECGKGFTRPHDLRRHVKTIHLMLYEHECQICGLKYKHKFNLAGHLQSFHKIIDDGN